MMTGFCRRPVSLLGVFLVVVTAGCSPRTVQEDRSINYSSEGGGVAFQHGEDGVYVASSDGESLQQIHDASDALAVSSPLWSPGDERLIFTTAHPVETEGADVAPLPAAWDADPEGRRFAPQQVTYTCWLREASGEGQAPQPSAIFTARCDHPGYVAANLAVRWHPSGERILFVDQDDSGGVSLFEFDLGSKSKRRLIEQRARALLFDWSPNHEYLTCSLFGVREDPAHDGIWVRSGEESEWWQVPRSDIDTPHKNVLKLELLRETRPAWTAEGEQFAFISVKESADRKQSRTVLRATPASRTVTQLYASHAPIGDLRWRPDSRQLAFVEGRPGSLRTLDETGEVAEPMSQFHVRRFVGWNHDGSKLAFISPEPHAEGESEWALLFPRIPGARDRVYVADSAAGEPARLVHDGVRITFPQWSPSENELSLWGTYAPGHVSLLSTVLPWTLRPGDPAAILDAASGDIRWMAVNRHEQSQVGHYYLLKRDYQRAWHWYEKAAEDRPSVDPLQLAEFLELIRQRRIFQNPLFFEYYCLTKLGRDVEAEQRLKTFRQSMTLEWEEEDLSALWLDLSDPAAKAQFARVVDFVTPVLQSAYMTEVFLSLDAAEDGAAFFKQQAEAAATDAERFASLVCLSQLMLASETHEEYAELVTYRLAPLAARLSGSQNLPLPAEGRGADEWAAWAEEIVVTIGGGIAGLPMASPEFLERLPEDQVRRWLGQWQAMREDATSETARLAADIVIHALLVRLDDDRQQELSKRIAANPLEFLPNEQEVTAEIEDLIQQVRGFASTITGSP